MNVELRNRLVLRAVFTGLLVLGQNVLMEALDRRDVVGRALALHDTSPSPLALVLVFFLVLRVFVYVVLPGLVLYTIVDAVAEHLAARRVSPSKGERPGPIGTGRSSH